MQLPRHFLKQSVDLIRENNGLYIADEVQTGFGRTGEHFWGFEGHGVIPDIVTMAKGIANGFPMGAVVTRPEIAQVLGRAMFFNTFGGNPVACSVGKDSNFCKNQEGKINQLSEDIYITQPFKMSKNVGEMSAEITGQTEILKFFRHRA